MYFLSVSAQQALKIVVNAVRIGLWQARNQPCAPLAIPPVGAWIRPNCALERRGNSIVKTVKVVSGDTEEGGMSSERVERLLQIVTKVSTLQSLHCGKIDNVRMNSFRTRLTYTISPLMFDCREKLKSTDEISSAIASVLAALADLHGDGILHNDVRWPNVMKCPTTGWKLVDFDHASLGDGRYLDHHVMSDYRRAVYDKFAGHASPLSDLYMVGLLVENLGSVTQVSVPAWLKLFASELKDGKTYTDAPAAIRALAAMRNDADAAIGASAAQ